MKKKISLILCMLAVMLSFAGCSNKKADVEYDQAGVEQVTEFLINYCANSDEATFQQWEKMTDFALEQQLTEASLPFTPESFRKALESWQAGVKECGEYIQHGDYTYEVNANEVKVSAPAQFDERKADLQFVFDKDLYLDSMTISAVYTKGEILEKAGLNTLMGMGTVFAVLIFISIIISLLKYVPGLLAAFSGKPKTGVSTAVSEKVPAPARVSEEQEEQKSADGQELIAVIAAAIAAAEGTTTDGFVVRSIRRRKSNKWNS